MGAIYSHGRHLTDILATGRWGKQILLLFSLSISMFPEVGARFGKNQNEPPSVLLMLKIVIVQIISVFLKLGPNLSLLDESRMIDCLGI